LQLAGELDDRWPGSRKRAGREESPDTETAQAVWATRLVTPGDEVAEGGVKPPYDSVTDSATENIPPAVRHPVIARRKTFGMSSWFARR